MNTGELEAELKKIDKCQGNNLGVFAADVLPPCNLLLRRGNFMVVNTDPVGKKGTHWLAIYCPDGNTVEVFYSYGYDLDTYPVVKRFLIDRCQPKVIRTMEGSAVQEETSDACGAHCVFYLAMRVCHGKSMDDIVYNIYGENHIFNDCIALMYLLM